MCTLRVTYYFTLHHYITAYYSLLLTNTCVALDGVGGIYTHISQFELKKTCEKKISDYTHI